jgi:uncharacterized protein YycO
LAKLVTISGVIGATLVLFCSQLMKLNCAVWLVESVEDAYNFMMNWLTKVPTVYGIFHSRSKLCW